MKRRRPRVVLPSIYYGELPAEARAAAFSVATTASVDQLTGVLDSLTDAVAGGETFQGWQARVRAGEIPLDLPRHRLENIYRTNVQQAWNTGRAEQQVRNQDARPFLAYSSVNDGRARDNHKDMHGTVLPLDHAWWSTRYPLNGYQCRCRAISLSREQAESRGITSNPTRSRPDPGFESGPLRDRTAGVREAADRAASSPASSRIGAQDQIREARGALSNPWNVAAAVEGAVGASRYGAARSNVQDQAKRAGIAAGAAAALNLYGQDEEIRDQVNQTVAHVGRPGYDSLPEGDDPDQALPVAGGMFEALEGLPEAPGRMSRVLDSGRLPAGFLAGHREGRFVRYSGMVSGMTGQGAAVSGDVRVIIEHQAGRTVGEFTGRPGEVMLPPGQVFEVLRRSGSVIYLRQVDTAPDGARVRDF